MEDQGEKKGSAVKNPDKSGNKVIGILNTIDDEGIPVKVVTTKDEIRGVQEQKVYTPQDQQRVIKTAASRITR